MIRSLRIRSRALVAVALFAALACGGEPSGEEASSDATGRAAPEMSQRTVPSAPADANALRIEVGELEAAVAAAGEAVAEAESSVAESEVALDDARETLAEKEAALEKARARLAVAAPPPPRISDAELFRSVQRQLLEAEALAHVAIAAEVEGGVVTLRGRVPDPATRGAAVEIARSVQGVTRVEDQIELPQ